MVLYYCLLFIIIVTVTATVFFWREKNTNTNTKSSGLRVCVFVHDATHTLHTYSSKNNIRMDAIGLFTALWNNDYTQVAKLLTPETVNLKDANQWTPLSITAFHGYRHIIMLLLQQPNIVINVTDSAKHPIWLAFQRGHYDIVLLLLHSVSVLPLMQLSVYILCSACSVGRLDIVHRLLTLGVDVNQPTCMGKLALCEAVRYKQEHAIHLLLQQPDIDMCVCDSNKQTPLHVACEIQCIDIVQLLLAHDSNAVNIQDSDDNTPLLIASRRNDDDIVDALLACGNARLNVCDKTGRSAVYCACQNNNAPMVSKLLQHERCLIADKSGTTPFTLCVTQQYLSCLHVIITMAK